jgi:membrane-bound lytic murein transglycosylase B
MSRKLPISASIFAALLSIGALLSQPADAAPGAPIADTAFSQEQQMGFGALMHRWDPLIAQASRRFDVPEKWIRIVMQVESGGRTMSGEKQPIVSRAGAMGLMQLMPSTYRDMRAEFGLGPDPFAPRDNIFAGAAYLRWLNGKYSYPAMFAAYNDGPGNLEARLMNAGLLPQETRTYVARVTAAIEGRGFVAAPQGPPVKFTRPNGLPVWIKPAQVISVRAAFQDEYAPGVQSVIAFGRIKQGVCENLAQVKVRLHLRGTV